MSLQIRIQELAWRELVDAVMWYKKQDVNAAHTFIEEVRQLSERIRAFPLMFAEVEPDLRRCPLKTFPYSLLYTVDNESIILLAVMHQHRQPSYWQNRIKGARRK